MYWSNCLSRNPLVSDMYESSSLSSCSLEGGGPCWLLPPLLHLPPLPLLPIILLFLLRNPCHLLIPLLKYPPLLPKLFHLLKTKNKSLKAQCLTWLLPSTHVIAAIVETLSAAPPPTTTPHETCSWSVSWHAQSCLHPQSLLDTSPLEFVGGHDSSAGSIQHPLSVHTSLSVCWHAGGSDDGGTGLSANVGSPQQTLRCSPAIPGHTTAPGHVVTDITVPRVTHWRHVYLTELCESLVQGDLASTFQGKFMVHDQVNFNSECWRS